MPCRVLVLACTVASAWPVGAEVRRAPVDRAARPAPAASAAAMPAVPLWVEWREVPEVMHEESSGGREASVSATPSLPTGQPGSWSTLPAPERDAAPDHRLRLANGGSARIAWAGAAPVAWLTDLWVETGPAPRQPSGGPPAGTIRPGASVRPAAAEGGRSLALTARWPGGAAPVTVDLRLDDAAAAEGRPQSIAGSTLVPLDRWTTVAQLTPGAGGGATDDRGTVGTRRAEPVRLLQLRVRLGALPPETALPAADPAATRRRGRSAAGAGPDPRLARPR